MLAKEVEWFSQFFMITVTDIRIFSFTLAINFHELPNFSLQIDVEHFSKLTWVPSQIIQLRSISWCEESRFRPSSSAGDMNTKASTFHTLNLPISAWSKFFFSRCECQLYCAQTLASSNYSTASGWLQNNGDQSRRAQNGKLAVHFCHIEQRECDVHWTQSLLDWNANWIYRIVHFREWQVIWTSYYLHGILHVQFVCCSFRSPGINYFCVRLQRNERLFPSNFIASTGNKEHRKVRKLIFIIRKSLASSLSCLLGLLSLSFNCLSYNIYFFSSLNINFYQFRTFRPRRHQSSGGSTQTMKKRTWTWHDFELDWNSMLRSRAEESFDRMSWSENIIFLAQRTGRDFSRSN